MPSFFSSMFASNHQLRLTERLAYSVGHFYNDLCAAMWFSYLIIFFQYLLKFESHIAGYILLLGQIVDAVSTPLIGIESDRTAGFCNYGKRKSWHLIGTVIVSISFPFIFLKCIYCSDADDWNQFVYYAPFVALFQFGWAAVQIAHMSIVNSLTSDESERVELYSWRNANTLVASIVVYGIAWILLGQDKDVTLGAEDIPKFMYLMITVVGVGLVFTTIYHIGVRENHGLNPAPLNNGQGSVEDQQPLIDRKEEEFNVMKWKDWFKEHQFYIVAGQYMLARLVFNLTQTYWPLYITETARLEKKYTAIIPMVICVAGFVSSLFMRTVNKLVGRKRTFGLGLLITVSSLVWLWFLPHNSMMIFGPAVVIGVGSNTLIISSLSMAADIVGNNVRSSAFVFGAMSFTDKLSSGVAVMLVQHFIPTCSCTITSTGSCCGSHADYFKIIMTVVPAGCIVVCVIILCVMIPMKLGRLRKYLELNGGRANDQAVSQNPVTESLDQSEEERRSLLRVNSSPFTRDMITENTETVAPRRRGGYGSTASSERNLEGSGSNEITTSHNSIQADERVLSSEREVNA